MNLAIRVEGLGKRYSVGGSPATGLFKTRIRNALIAPFRAYGGGERGWSRIPTPSREMLWALRDVSFEVRRGEVVGLIGHNGAGKSVLLKVLSRLSNPTTGVAEVYGRVGSLLEVGTGFHPELSGRENVYLNGAILGMSRDEIQRRFDEIVEFSGVQRFIDAPIKHYSSGMAVRLAFSVAAHLEAEIMFLDEVWATGDQDFQQKSLRKMYELVGGGRTVVVVSHGLAQIESLCPRCLWLDHGRLVGDGPTPEIVQRYVETGARLDAPPQLPPDTGADDRKLSSSSARPVKPSLLHAGGVQSWRSGAPAPGDARFRLREARLVDTHGAARDRFAVDEPIRLSLELEVETDDAALRFGFTVSDAAGRAVRAGRSDAPMMISAGRIEADGLLSAGDLPVGEYALSVFVGSEDRFATAPEVDVDAVLVFSVTQRGGTLPFPRLSSSAVFHATPWTVRPGGRS